MNRKRNDKKHGVLPFALDANGRDSLTNQLVDGIKSAIDAGVYRQGDRLPTWRQLSAELGVSDRVPRDAMRRLQREGYVVARPRLGCMAAKPAGEKRWKGTVAVVYYEADEVAYHMSRLVGEMRRRLAMAGYLLLPVSVRSSERNEFDFCVAQMIFRFKVDLAVVLCNHICVSRWIDELGIPFVAPQFYEKLLHCIGTVRGSSLALALAAFATHCRSAGIHTVLEVGFCLPSSFSVCEVLAPQGIDVERWRISPMAGRERREGVREAAYAAFCRRFGSKHHCIPDLIVFTDDVVASGAFLALEHLRVAIPQDVRVMTLANEGDLPVSVASPTCILNRPKVRGRALARYVVDLMDGKRSAEMANVDYVYRIGQTFPRT